MKKFLYKVMSAFFSFCNNLISFAVKYPALIICVLLVLGLAILILLVNNKANVGGVLSKVLSLFGLGNNKTNIEVANTIPPSRQQALEEADEKGFAQHKVSELETSINPFRDKSVIILPDGKKVQLPSGIKDTDVDIVIESTSQITLIPTEESYDKLLSTQQVIQEAESVNSQAKDLLARLKERQK